MKMDQIYHSPVLLQESIAGLNIKPNGIYVDVTFGGGGHSREILKHLGENGRLISFDQDKDALNNAIDDSRFLLINENFSLIQKFLRFYKIDKVDGILADLGVSSHQFDEASRGFSTRFDGILDMRMNQNKPIDAKYIINEYEEKELKRVFYDYGELRAAAVMANTIVNARAKEAIQTSEQLKSVLSRFLPAAKTHKILAQIYQAIRIEVNEELEALKTLLAASLELLKPNGRLSVISYHSLEDRLVKRIMKNGIFEGEPEKDVFGNTNVPFKIVEKLIVPSNEEIKINNRARSAKLRIAEKT
jgi:16S rRNA (cytosine1402-N4)-methyltransferase